MLGTSIPTVDFSRQTIDPQPIRPSKPGTKVVYEIANPAVFDARLRFEFVRCNDRTRVYVVHLPRERRIPWHLSHSAAEAALHQLLFVTACWLPRADEAILARKHECRGCPWQSHALSQLGFVFSVICGPRLGEVHVARRRFFGNALCRGGSFLLQLSDRFGLIHCGGSGLSGEDLWL